MGNRMSRSEVRWLARTSLFVLPLVAAVAAAQQRTLPSEGVADRPTRSIALTNARVVPEPGRVIENATVLLSDGRIESVGSGLRVPAGYEVATAPASASRIATSSRSLVKGFRTKTPTGASGSSVNVSAS